MLRKLKLFTLPDLFAGKLHAVLCREWKNRIKGRDYYDLLWYLGKKIPCHPEHLRERMIQTGHWEAKRVLDREILLDLLDSRFRQVDFDAARQDVSPFIKDRQEPDLRNPDFFCGIVRKMDVC